MMLGMSKVETIEREILELNTEEFAMLSAWFAQIEQDSRENQSLEVALTHRQAFFKLSKEEQHEQMRLGFLKAQELGIYDLNHELMALVDDATDDGIFDD